MQLKSLFLTSLIVVASLSFILTTGCTSENGNSCGEALSDIYSLENAADGRLKVMDISNPDDFISAQAHASKNQYSDALIILTSGDAKGCMYDTEYRNMVRSLELKYSFLDMYIKFVETENTISTMLAKSYPEFQKELKDTMTDLENQRYEVKSMKVMANEIDTSVLKPESQDMMPVIKKDLDIVGLKIDAYISLLVPFQ